MIHNKKDNTVTLDNGKTYNLKATDFRIGNYVGIPTEDAKGKKAITPRRVSLIAEGVIKAMLNKAIGMELQITDGNIVPVKITEDILEKIGFKCIDKEIGIFQGQAGVDLVRNGEKGWFFDGNDKTVQYVHELQNRFYIEKGFEMEIIL